MNSTYRNIISSCVSLFLVVFPIQIAQNCGQPFGYMDEAAQVVLFNPNVLDEAEFVPFYLNPKILSGTDDLTKDYERNCEEWQAQFSDSISIKDIYTVLYQTDPDSFLMAYNDQSLSRLVRENTFIEVLTKTKNYPFLDYLYMAFQVEFSHFAKENPWGFKEDEEALKREYRPLTAWLKLINNTENTFEDLPLFLKERYGYQLIVNYRYVGFPQKCIDLFDKYLANSTSIVRAWASIHVGHAWFLLKNIPASNFAFAMSFDGCESKRVRAVRGFDIQKTDSTLALTKTPKERAAVHALSMMQNPGKGLDAIQTIVKVSPDYHYLPLLIQREVNKIENWLLAPFLLNQKALMDIDWERDKRKPKIYDNHYYYDDEWYWKENPTNFDIRSQYYQHKNYQKDLKYLRKFRAVLLQLVGKIELESQQDFLNLAIAHLYFLDFKPQAAWKYLNQVDEKAKLIIKTQAHIEKLLILPQMENVLNKNTQAKLYESLHFLKKNKASLHEYDRSISQLHLYLARAFYQKGSMPEAGLLTAQVEETIIGDGGSWSEYYNDIVFFDKYATLKEMDQTLKYYRKKKKTPFQSYVCKTYGSGQSNWKEEGTPENKLGNALLEVKGTIAFRQDKLKTANQCFAELPVNYWNETYQFSDYLYTPFHRNDSYYGSNKQRVVERMIDLKRHHSPDSLLILADAYFNTSYHGRSWMMFSYGRFPDEWKKENVEYYYNFLPNAERYKTVYYEAGRAIYYYKKVLNHRKASLEQKAVAAFRIGNCERATKRWIEDKTREYGDERKRHFTPHHYILFNKFKKAKNYDDLMGCTSFYYDYEKGIYTDKKPISN